ncbi:hypothetical protein PIIN_01178 [Serendipita indica DSM 11827]|uniref:Uncharacterized protein n=1 Tax=Serendipita indica (strain DSM 11827) TaxID=1109443 RepID=G4T7N2_SERID|nr:hypothetical protein PIIN_01178 [Serendipita indica DSM 11827]
MPPILRRIDSRDSRFAVIPPSIESGFVRHGLTLTTTQRIHAFSISTAFTRGEFICIPSTISNSCVHRFAPSFCKFETAPVPMLATGGFTPK